MVKKEEFYYNTTEVLEKLILRKSNLSEIAFRLMLQEKLQHITDFELISDDELDDVIESGEMLQKIYGFTDSTFSKYIQNFFEKDSYSINEIVSDIELKQSGRILSILARSPRERRVHVNNWSLSLLREYLDKIDFEYDLSNLKRTYTEFDQMMLNNPYDANNLYPNMQATINDFTGHWIVLWDQDDFKYSINKKRKKESFGRLFAIRLRDKHKSVKVLSKLVTENKIFYPMFNELVRKMMEYEHEIREVPYELRMKQNVIEHINIAITMLDAEESRNLILRFGEETCNNLNQYADVHVTFILGSEPIVTVKETFYEIKSYITQTEYFDTMNLDRRGALDLLRKNNQMIMNELEDYEF
ncbi:MAG: hypothetical protein JXR88_14450 [Clostridia bacterium]|nr:hypothetical protein [Clostridia bacterium]